MNDGFSLRGPECRVELEAYSVTLIADLKVVPATQDEMVIHGAGSEEDFEALKVALEKRLGYTPPELALLDSYEQSLSLLLSKLDQRLRSGFSNLPSVLSLHSLALSVDRQKFVMNAVFDGDVDVYFDDTLSRFGALIDLVWRHCVGYPGAQPDGSYTEDDRARFRGWISTILVDPNADSSFLYVRRSNLQGAGTYTRSEMSTEIYRSAAG